MSISASPRRSWAVGRALQLLCWIGLGWVLVTGIVSILLHYQVDVAAAQRYFSSDDIERGLQYGFERKLLGWTARLVYFGFLAAMALTPLGVRVTVWCGRLAGGRWLLTVLFVALFVYLALLLLGLPFSLIGFYHGHLWGVANLRLDAWLIDYVLEVGVAIVMEVLPLVVLYCLIRWLPRSWWLVASGAALIYGIAIALLHPVLVAPLFNTFTPLSQTRWADLEPQVRTLLYQAELPVQEILVVDASRQGTHSNAFFMGFGGTRRIVLYDTLLQSHSKDANYDQVMSVLAHEVGHWRHDHIVKGLLLAGLAVVLALFLLSRLLLALVDRPPWRLGSPSDPVGYPLVFLLGTLVSWLSLPLQNMVSRHFERQADQTALELADPKAFLDAEITMGKNNLSNVTPHPVSVWFFASHPTVLERIDMARKASGLP